MEEKNEFSDILLERESEAKASKFKKIALIAAVFVLIFLSVLIIMKIVNKPDKQNDNSRLTIQPKASTPPTVEAKNDPLFKQVPIIEEDSKKESFEEMVKKLKEKESKRAEEQKTQSAKQETKEPKETLVPIVETKKEPPVKVVSPAKKAPPKSIPKTQPVKPTKSIPKIPDPKPRTTSSDVAKGIYIQVTATSKSKPDSKYLASIKSKGYSYHLYKTTVKNKNFIKILVGPYKSSKAAQDNLAKVKKELSKNAFVFKVP